MPIIKDCVHGNNAFLKVTGSGIRSAPILLTPASENGSRHKLEILVLVQSVLGYEPWLGTGLSPSCLFFTYRNRSLSVRLILVRHGTLFKRGTPAVG